MSAQHIEFAQKWAALHPHWEMKPWTDEFIQGSRFKEFIARAQKFSSKSNIIRLEVIERYGGVYCDTDVEPLRCFDTLLEGIEAFCGYEIPDTRVCNAVFAAAPHHPWLKTLLATLPAHASRNPPWGPDHMTASLALHPEVARFDQNVFYPLLWNSSPSQIAEFGADAGTFAKHYWAHGW